MRKTRSDAYRESDSDGEMMRVLGIGGLHHSEAFKQREFPDLSPRAYRICQGFDSAAALVSEEGVVAAAAEERFTYKKGTGAFPVNAIAY